MHKPFYASGFFYHSPTQQILLHQPDSDEKSPLMMFHARGDKGEDPKHVFKKSVQNTIGLALDIEAIIPVYDYTHEKLGDQFVFYVEVFDTPDTPKYKKKSTKWTPLAKLSKIQLSEQTRHDIIVGERVIRSSHEPENKHAPRS